MPPREFVMSNIERSDDWIDGYTSGFADAAKPLGGDMERLAKEVAPMAAQLAGAVKALEETRAIADELVDYVVGSKERAKFMDRLDAAGGQ